MSQEIDLGGTIYISSRRAAEITGYAQDYIGQLARSGQIEARRVAGLWYVLEESLKNYKQKADEFKPIPPGRGDTNELEASVSFDGKDYISAARAARITGYSQDYVGQLARSEKILSRQIGIRWYVDRAGIIEHKRHNDSLLAAVQAESVGINKNTPTIEALEPQEEVPHYSYLTDTTELYPQVSEKEPEIAAAELEEPIGEEDIAPIESINAIPIRVIPAPPKPYVPEPHARLQKSIQNYASLSKMTAYFIVFVVVSVSVFSGVLYFGLPGTNRNNESVAENNGAQASAVNSSVNQFGGNLTKLALAVFSKELEYKRP